MVPLSVGGIEDVIAYRSAADQTLGWSLRVKDFEGVSRVVRGLDEDASPPAGSLSMGSRCIVADA